MSNVISYKGFKIKKATPRTCDYYGVYTCFDEYLIINKEGSYEWSDSTIQHCKEWIDSYEVYPV